MKNIINTTNDKNNLEEVINTIFDDLKDFNIDNEKKIYIELIIEELFINICNYAYDDVGCIRVSYSIGGKPLKMNIQFLDKGKKFNPLLVKSNNKKSINERLKGGLGILLTKQFADKIIYIYKNDCNRLSIKLSLQDYEKELDEFVEL